MILITEYNDNYGGCMENQIPCVQLGQNPSNDEIIESLKNLKIFPNAYTNNIIYLRLGHNGLQK